MNLSIGIVGLPNVGKSTLFNALLKKQQALVANYPFATIDPNVGVVSVPDGRLDELAKIEKEEHKMSQDPPVKHATVEFVDIAGLVKGASEGQGLGNKFLSHIREVSVVAHVVRAFEDENILKEGAVDPKSDYDTIRTELQIADLETFSNMSEKALRTEVHKKSAVEKLKQALESGKNANQIELSDEEREAIKELNLLTSKEEIVVLNVAETDYNPSKIEQTLGVYAGLLNIERQKIIVISAKIEAELAALSIAEQKEYLKDLGMEESGLERLIKKAYEELGLISFLTAGEKEVRAWTIRKGSTAVEAAGEIHTDFIKHFIKAEVISYSVFVSNGGWKGARENGKTRFEGRDYIVKDGEVVEFKIGS